MFQPQPTPFSTFFPTTYLPPQVDSLAPQQNVENDGLQGQVHRQQQMRDGAFVRGQQLHAQAHSHSQQAQPGGGFHNSFQQAPSFQMHQQASLGVGVDVGVSGRHGHGQGAVNPGPGGSLAGPGALGLDAARSHGGASASVAATRTPGVPAPLSTVGFPLHGAIPHSQLNLDLDLDLHFDHSPTTTTLQHRPRHHHYSSVPSRTKMEPNQSLQDDLAAQEAAARTWQPELEGPRVGNKTAIDAITAEYAKADPVYVTKTLALPQTYSYYRPVKGDGNCGWRAIGFCYFELLIQQGSQEFIQGEQLRISQLNDYLATSGGYDPDMFMDFTQETFQLFTDVSDALDTPDKALDILTQRFNDDASMAIIYHLRLLAGSWLKGNRDQYEAWCETGVDGYCSSMIEPPEREIEELGIVLLVEALLKPVGFILEIAYLDRSAGTEVNTHRFPESNNSLGPFIHLLYRPGHYDILYKPIPTEIQVNRMAYEPTAFSDLHTISGGMDFNPLAMIPGVGLLGPMSTMGQLGGPSLDYSPSPQSPWYPSSHADSSPTPPSQHMTASCSYMPQPQKASISTQPTTPANSVSTNPTHEIRFSRYQYEGPLNASPEPTFQTNMFKNSHYNKAHYNNPDFTPEEYKPGADDGIEVQRSERPSRRNRHGKGTHHSSDDGSDIKREK